jgi:ribosomal protein S27E
MGLMYRIKEKLRIFMIGRNGVDRLSMHMLWFGIALLVIATMISSYVLNLISFAVYVLAILRIVSKNIARRSAENRFYVNKTYQIKKAVTHRRNRYKNRKQFKYFKCPNCKSWLRVPRKAGQVKVTCGKCGNKFSYIVK